MTTTDIQLTDDTEICERELLGAILNGYRHIDELGVREPDFRRPGYGLIFDACQRVAASGERPGIANVRLAIGPTMPGNIDTGTTLHTLAQNGLAAQAPYWAEQVAAAADRRALHDVGIRVQQLAGSEKPVDELVEEARQMIDGAPRRTVTTPQDFAAGFADLVERVEQGRDNGLSLPYSDLDDCIMGLHPGHLYVVAGRPGSGKSLVGQGIATHIAKQGKAAVIASLEMSDVEYRMRITADLGSIDLSTMIRGTTDNQVHARIGRVLADHRDLPLFIDGAFDQTVTHIRSHARTVARTRPLGVIVVDYLQLVSPRDRKLPRHEQVAEMSRSLKALAKELGVAVVALAQLNRNSEQRTDKRPQVSDLRESGALEQDADVVVLLHRDPEKSWEVSMFVGKNRWGVQREFPLQFWGHYARLTNSTEAGR